MILKQMRGVVIVMSKEEYTRWVLEFDKGKRRIFGFTLNDWIIIWIIFGIGILIGLQFNVSYIYQKVENECNEFILERLGIDINKPMIIQTGFNLSIDISDT